MSDVLAVALMGPTASGKSELAVQLAQRLNGEVISVDSALVYKGLDIGAAKPSLDERRGIPHWLIDIRDPAIAYSAAEFCQDAKQLIEKIVARGKVPILAGGTMLYFKALLEGLSPMPPSDPELRVRIESDAKKIGWPSMHERLARVDPESAQRIHPNHSQRIARAIEVWEVSGKPMSEWQDGGTGGLNTSYRWQQFALVYEDRAILHDRIAHRFDVMLNEGLIDEVRALYKRKDLHSELPAMRAVGYRQVWQYLDGDFPLEELRDRAVAATRQLAKRQLTWLRGWHGIQSVKMQKNDGQLRLMTEIADECLSFC